MAVPLLQGQENFKIFLKTYATSNKSPPSKTVFDKDPPTSRAGANGTVKKSRDGPGIGDLDTRKAADGPGVYVHKSFLRRWRIPETVPWRHGVMLRAQQRLFRR